MGHRTWSFWARGTLLTALAGHWVANLLLDEGQYERAGLAFTWYAVAPAVLQTILVLALVVALGSGTHPPGRVGRRSSGRFRLLPLLAAAQLALFFAFEVSERVIQREPFSGGLFGSDFVFELLFALGSAFLLVVLGSVALRMIGSSRRRPMTHAIHDPVRPIPDRVVPLHAVVASGGVRAPPALAKP